MFLKPNALLSSADRRQQSIGIPYFFLLNFFKNSYVTHIKYVFCHFVIYLFLKIFLVFNNHEGEGMVCLLVSVLVSLSCHLVIVSFPPHINLFSDPSTYF